MVSRGIAGIRNRSLIVPGTTKSIPQIGEAIEEGLVHAVKLIGQPRLGYSEK